MFKRLVLAVLCMALLAGCAAVVETPVDDITAHSGTVAPQLEEITANPDWPWCEDCGGPCYYAELMKGWPSTAPMHIEENPTDEFIAQFSNTHDFVFGPLPEWVDEHRVIVVWADEPLRDFSLVGLYPNWISGGEGIHATDTQYVVEQLLPGEAFVLHDWFGPYQYPTAGFTFIDEAGIQRYMSIVQCQIGGCAPALRLNYFDNTPPNN